MTGRYPSKLLELEPFALHDPVVVAPHRVLMSEATKAATKSPLLSIALKTYASRLSLIDSANARSGDRQRRRPALIPFRGGSTTELTSMPVVLSAQCAIGLTDSRVPHFVRPFVLNLCTNAIKYCHRLTQRFREYFRVAARHIPAVKVMGSARRIELRSMPEQDRDHKLVNVRLSKPCRTGCTKVMT
jgi:hypothetical protein